MLLLYSVLSWGLSIALSDINVYRLDELVLDYSISTSFPPVLALLAAGTRISANALSGSIDFISDILISSGEILPLSNIFEGNR